MNEVAAADWALVCWVCKKGFMLTDAYVTDEQMVCCPHCSQWSGVEIRKRRPVIDTEQFSDPGQDRILNEVWAWVCEDPKTTLEGFCGFMADGIPFQAVSGSRDTALKMRPYIERAKKLSGKKFRLVRYVKEDVLLEL